MCRITLTGILLALLLLLSFQLNDANPDDTKRIKVQVQSNLWSFISRNNNPNPPQQQLPNPPESPVHVPQPPANVPIVDEAASDDVSENDDDGVSNEDNEDNEEDESNDDSSAVEEDTSSSSSHRINQAEDTSHDDDGNQDSDNDDVQDGGEEGQVVVDRPLGPRGAGPTEAYRLNLRDAWDTYGPDSTTLRRFITRPVTDALAQLVQSSYSGLHRMIELGRNAGGELGTHLILPASWTPDTSRITTVFVGHFPPSTHLRQVLSNGILWANDSGMLGELCWRAVVNVLVDIGHRHFGVPEPVARAVIMSSTAFINRNPIAMAGSAHSDPSTHQAYSRFASLMDPLSRELVGWLTNQLPNLDQALAFGSPSYTAVIEGGGALQGSWFGEELGRHLTRFQTQALPHMLQIQTRWAGEAARDSFLDSVLPMLENMFQRFNSGPLVDRDSYLRAASSPSSILEEITRLVPTNDGRLLSLDIVRQMQAEEPSSQVAVVNQSSERAMGSLYSLRTAIRNGAEEAFGKWACSACSVVHESGISYNAPHSDCSHKPRGCFTLIGGIDPLIRGYCSHCDYSGLYNGQHRCSVTGSAAQRYDRLVPREGFSYKMARKKTPMLTRLYDITTERLEGTFTNLKEIGLSSIEKATELLQQEQSQLGRNIPFSRSCLPKWILKHTSGGGNLVYPLAISDSTSLDRRDSRMMKYIKCVLNYENNGLQDGSFVIGNYRYEGVPIMEE